VNEQIVAINDGSLVATSFGFGIHQRGVYTANQVFNVAQSLKSKFTEREQYPVARTPEFFDYAWCHWDKLSLRAASEMVARVRLNSTLHFDPLEYTRNYAGLGEPYLFAWQKYITAEQRLTALRKAFKRKYFDRQRLLDLGCAGGRHLLQLAAAGFDTFGIEANPAYFQDIHPMLTSRVFYGDALMDTYWFKADSFDTVICSAHGTINWPELDQLLSEITRILVLGGVLLFDVPVEPITLGDRQQKDFRIYSRLLKRCGFKVHMISYNQLVCTNISKSFNAAASI
jgi:SAM-dependent methyltransferase